MSDATRWFWWGNTVAVVRGAEAYSVGRSGWRPVDEADVTHDGREMSEADALRTYADDIELFGDPPLKTSS